MVTIHLYYHDLCSDIAYPECDVIILAAYDDEYFKIIAHEEFYKVH